MRSNGKVKLEPSWILFRPTVMTNKMKSTEMEDFGGRGAFCRSGTQFFPCSVESSRVCAGNPRSSPGTQEGKVR